MNKTLLIQQIMNFLADDLALLTAAARHAHQAATHEECLPDNKYDTTALEASYIAQGQANRAQEIRIALESFRTLEVREFTATDAIRLTALVTAEDDDGTSRRFFLAPHAGGMKVTLDGLEIMVITPASPLGKSLLGCNCGDELPSGATTLTITSVS